jgi:hypothetical protein
MDMRIPRGLRWGRRRGPPTILVLGRHDQELGDDAAGRHSFEGPQRPPADLEHEAATERATTGQNTSSPLAGLTRLAASACR